MSRNKPTYTQEFKTQALKLAMLNGVTQTSKELGIAPASIYRWKVEASVAPDQTTEELKRAKTEIKRLQMENDILKKAAAYRSVL